MQAYKLPARYVSYWRRDYDKVLQQCNKPKRRTDSLTLPQGADAVNLVGSLWSGLFSTIRKDQNKLIPSYLAHYDSKRSFARLSSASEALELKALLVTCGLKPTDIAVLDSESYMAEKKATDAERRVHSPGILADYWALETEHHAECALELRALEAEQGPTSTIVALTVGSHWPSKIRDPSKLRKSKNKSNYRHQPVRQLNYAVRFTLLLFAAFHGLDVRRQTLDSTKNLRPRRSVADLRGS